MSVTCPLSCVPWPCPTSNAQSHVLRSCPVPRPCPMPHGHVPIGPGRMASVCCYGGRKHTHSDTLTTTQSAVSHKLQSCSLTVHIHFTLRRMTALTFKRNQTHPSPTGRRTGPSGIGRGNGTEDKAMGQGHRANPIRFEQTQAKSNIEQTRSTSSEIDQHPANSTQIMKLLAHAGKIVHRVGPQAIRRGHRT